MRKSWVCACVLVFLPLCHLILTRFPRTQSLLRTYTVCVSKLGALMWSWKSVTVLTRTVKQACVCVSFCPHSYGLQNLKNHLKFKIVNKFWKYSVMTGYALYTIFKPLSLKFFIVNKITFHHIVCRATISGRCVPPALGGLDPYNIN